MKLLLLIPATLLLCVPAANAKEYLPDDISVCGATRCRVVPEAPALGRFIYGAEPVTRAPTPRVGAAIYQIRMQGRPAGAIVTATAARVHGLNCSRFRRGRWYRLPRELRNLGAGLSPKRLRASVPRSC